MARLRTVRMLDDGWRRRWRRKLFRFSAHIHFLVRQRCVAGVRLYDRLSGISARRGILVQRVCVDAAIGWVGHAGNMHSMHHRGGDAALMSNVSGLYGRFGRLRHGTKLAGL